MGAPQLIFTYEKITLFNDNRVNYGKYSKFADERDFNNQWEQYMLNYKTQFTKLQLDALRIYRQFAVKEGRVGVVNASYRTLMTEAEKFYGFKISRDTFRQAIQKLEKLGGCVIADGQRMIKGRGSRTANIVIFNRHDEALAYQIAQKKKQDEEIAALLEQDYATASPIVNYAYNARKWAEEKRLKQAKADAAKAAAEQQAAEQAAKTEKVSLYRRIAKLLSSKKSVKTVQLNEAVAIAYSSVKKLVAVNVSQLDAEELCYKELADILGKDNVKKVAALYSWKLNKVINTIKGETNELSQGELIQKQGGYVEYVPDFLLETIKDPVKRAQIARNNELFYKGVKHQEEEKQAVLIDFEAERAKILEKLGHNE